MSENLKQIEDDVIVQIPATGSPGDITGQNHQNLLKAFLNASGKFTGFVFDAIADGVPTTGKFSWMDTPMNEPSPFVVKFHEETGNGQKILNIIQQLRVNDYIKFKDYQGRVAVLKYVSHGSATESGQNIINVTVTGLPENPSVAYVGAETFSCVFEFFTQGATKTSELINDSGFITLGDLPPTPTDFVSASLGGTFLGDIRIGDPDMFILPGKHGILLEANAGRFAMVPEEWKVNQTQLFDINMNNTGGTDWANWSFSHRDTPGGTLNESFQMIWGDDPGEIYFDNTAQNAFNGSDGVYALQMQQPNTLLTLGAWYGGGGSHEKGDRLRVIGGNLEVDGDARMNTARMFQLLETTEDDPNTLVVQSDGVVAIEKDIPSEVMTLTVNWSGSLIVEVKNGNLQIDVNVTRSAGSAATITTLPSYFRHFKYARVPFSSTNASTVGFLEFRPWNGQIALVGTYPTGGVQVSRNLPFRA